MKLSELISIANTILSEHGNIDVCITASFFGHNNVIPISDVQVKHDQITGIFDHNGKTVLVID